MTTLTGDACPRCGYAFEVFDRGACPRCFGSGSRRQSQARRGRSIDADHMRRIAYFAGWTLLALAAADTSCMWVIRALGNL